MSAEPVIMSPCMNVCIMNEETGYCQGCYRTLDEIADWGRFSARQKSAVVKALKIRRRTDQPAITDD
jgi:predicted Fe-S protein YdhL (DUF1289 family)